MSEPAKSQQIRPPEWDREAVAAPYLTSLQQRLRSGDRPSATWLDQLFSDLSSELRSVYRGRDIDEALAGLDKLLAKYDAAVAAEPSEDGFQQRWRRVSSKTAPRLPGIEPPRLPQRRRRRRYRSNPALAVLDFFGSRFAGPVTSPKASLPPSPASSKSAAPAPIDGKALNRSIIPTWLMLVAMSWVSLLWGTMLSMPIGVGLVMALNIALGIFAIPLWGTFWGLIGMNAARGSTLRSMGFEEVPREHPLHVIAATYAKQLDLETPQVGTIGVHNAFAMGTRRNNATIAIGRPLLEEFTPDEIAAIVAHELGHVATGDMRSMMLMRTFQNATVAYMVLQRAKLFARYIICWAAELLILASSRRREFRADAIAAVLAGKEATMSALRRLEDAPALTRDENTHARFMIRGRWRGLLSTHPSTERRIQMVQNETYIRKLPRRS